MVNINLFINSINQSSNPNNNIQDICWIWWYFDFYSRVILENFTEKKEIISRHSFIHWKEKK